MLLSTLLNLTWTLIAVALGGYLLLFGRRAQWVLLGSILFVVTGIALARFVEDAETIRELVVQQEWLWLGIALAVGLAGAALARLRPDLATLVLGAAMGIDFFLWFYDITYHFFTNMAALPAAVTNVLEIVIVVLGALAGIWLIRTYRDEALIIFAMFVGAELVYRGLQLSSTSSWTAIILLSLALTSVVVQYADYLREQKLSRPLIEVLAEERLNLGYLDHGGPDY